MGGQGGGGFNFGLHLLLREASLVVVDLVEDF